ncbi:hypothetical protein KUV85_07300 [Nocardioides panacisoli]|uniref:hypothetical protein n=1 Tax=Nocardioides panacisoli TaxID=627624 RepID=UPI001C62DE02|nr:hypothetical protein [Nocardioides panacisoli]QYJ05481.1 hypothetical protein KUV85_07300 [Nocardioides panacisoli]
MNDEQQPALPIRVHGHPNHETVLLWHPAVPEGDTRITDLAARIANRGKRVVEPTWHDGRDLLRSLRYARETAVHPPDDLTLVGYDEAAVAALAMAVHQRRLGVGLTEVACIGGREADDPISGQPLPESPPPPRVATTLTFVAGSAAAWTRRTAEAWKSAGWPVELAETDQFT